MPTTKEITLFSFDELSDEVQEEVFAAFLRRDLWDNWWEHIYQDAAIIGLEIKSFDLHRGTIDGEMFKSLFEVWKLICENHGTTTKTFEVAAELFVEWCTTQIQLSQSDASMSYVELFADSNAEDKAHEIEIEFKRALLEEYRIMLQEEYDYLFSRERITGFLLEGGFLFTKDGQSVNC